MTSPSPDPSVTSTPTSGPPRRGTASHRFTAEEEKVLAEFAARYDELTAGLFDDDPDLCIER